MNAPLLDWLKLADLHSVSAAATATRRGMSDYCDLTRRHVAALSLRRQTRASFVFVVAAAAAAAAPRAKAETNLLIDLLDADEDGEGHLFAQYLANFLRFG